MQTKKVNEKPKNWNELAGHPLQAWEWGEFRKAVGMKVVRYGIFEKEGLVEPIQVTIHLIPHTPWTIGYYPKGGEITCETVKVLRGIAKENNCVYIKCEPMMEVDNQYAVVSAQEMRGMGFRRGRSLFTPHNFVLDVTPSEDELLAKMKSKTRYNIRLAKKKGVTVAIDNSEKAFARYLELTEETTKRQGFYAHSTEYHKRMWEVLRQVGMAELMVGKFEKKIITAWVVFAHNNTLYYPYGASTREHRNLMANNLVMWEAIKLAKKKKLKYLDMWGALGPDPDKKDPWYGFHKFKAGYGARHVTYVGTWDYVASPLLYYPLRVVEWVRWVVLRARA